jgi:hypothetical protein
MTVPAHSRSCVEHCRQQYPFSMGCGGQRPSCHKRCDTSTESEQVIGIGVLCGRDDTAPPMWTMHKRPRPACVFPQPPSAATEHSHVPQGGRDPAICSTDCRIRLQIVCFGTTSILVPTEGESGRERCGKPPMGSVSERTYPSGLFADRAPWRPMAI